MKPYLIFAVFLFFATAVSAQVIDDTPTRVQTTLAVDWRPVGTLRPKSVNEISTSRWTLGCEVLDREYANYDSYKEYLAPLGIKRIRLQAGWARTEKEKGLYDFAWLDHIIDDARSRGLEVLLETSYGNPIYAGGGGRSLAGGFPTSDEGLAAWDQWVTTMARRYKDKVGDWAIWNEPSVANPNALFDFTIRTARLIKSEIPTAKIGALVLMQSDYAVVGPFLERCKNDNALDLFCGIVYHHYTANPDEPYPAVEKMKAVIRSYSPILKLMQGESGTMSEWGPSGALNKTHWTELTQAKWDARRMLGDLGHDADSAVFTIADFEYRTTPWLNGPAPYGLVKAAGAAKGFKILKVKMAYYAVQNVVSVFNDSLGCDENFNAQTTCEKSVSVFGYRFVENGKPLVVFWDDSAAPSNDNTTVKAVFTLQNTVFETPVWVDVITGNAYEIPPENVSVENGTTTFKDVPVCDAPTFITDRNNLDLDQNEYVKAIFAK